MVTYEVYFRFLDVGAAVARVDLWSHPRWLNERSWRRLTKWWIFFRSPKRALMIQRKTETEVLAKTGF